MFNFGILQWVEQTTITTQGWSTTIASGGRSADISISGANNTIAVMTSLATGSVFIDTTKTSGKWYFEVKFDYTGATANYFVGAGIGNANTSGGSLCNNIIGFDSTGWLFGMNGASSSKNTSFNNNIKSVYGATISSSHTVMMAVDIDNKNLYTGYDGIWNGTTPGNPMSGSLGTGKTFLFSGSTIWFGSSMQLLSGAIAATATLNNGSTTSYNIPPDYLTLGGNANSFRTETNNYIRALGLSFPIAQANAIDRLVRDLNGESNVSYTTYNVWNRLYVLYPMLGGTSYSVSVNLITPGTYNLRHVSGPTTSSLGISYNGTTNYSDTGLGGNNSGTTNDITGFGFHRRDSNEDADATFGISLGGSVYAIIRSDKYRLENVGAQGLEPVNNATPLAVNALWSAGYSAIAPVLGATSVGKVYRNGITVSTITNLTMASTGTQSLYVGAHRTILGHSHGGPCTFDYLWIRSGEWNNAEEAFMYNAFNALQTAFGR